MSTESGGDIAFSMAKKVIYVATFNPLEGGWYQFFAIGCAARIGDVVRQDRAYSIQIVLRLVDMYEREFQDDIRKLSYNAMNSCIFLLVTCLGGIRGFEDV